MTSSHPSPSTSFKPRRIKTAVKPTHQITNKEPCPRCHSVNTKFCYYNNYSLSQPRHYCKSCRRYWTRGGALRNVPIGGSTRNKTKPSSLHVISPPSNLMALSSSSHELVGGFRTNRAFLNPYSTARTTSSVGYSSYMFASSSIESLHQKLQQERLVTSMLLQDSLTATVKPAMFQNVELLPPPTDWSFDRSAMGGGGAPNGSHGNNGGGGDLENWYHSADNNLLL